MSTEDISRPDPFEHPDAPAVAAWLVALGRAVRGTRIYAANNETLIRYIDDAHRLLTELLTRIDAIVLAVREDRLVFAADSVFVDINLQESIPFILYRSGFRRISFEPGMEREEIVALVGAIVADYASFDLVEEDLVSALWRLALPHFRYVVVDILAIDPAEADTEDEREEIERIQQDIESIVAKVFDTGEKSDDTVAGISITRADIEAFAEASKEDKETIEKLDRQTARPITDIPQRVITELEALENEAHRATAAFELCRTWVAVLLEDPAPSALGGSLHLIDDLLDTIVMGGRYAEATEICGMVIPPPDAAHAMSVLAVVTKRPRILSALETLANPTAPVDPKALSNWLSSLGPVVTPTLLDGLERLPNPAHRRLICEVVMELGVPDISMLLTRMQVAEWFVRRDLLSLADAYGPDDLELLVVEGANDAHPKVRERAIGAARRMRAGQRDVIVARHIEDDEPVVRLAAVRVAASLAMKRARPVVERRVQLEVLQELDTNEMRALIMAYVRLAQDEAIPRLEKLLNPPLLKRLSAPAVQVTAALGLGALNTPNARAVLEKARTRRNRRIREACERALESGGLGNTIDINRIAAMTGDIPMTGDIRAATEQEVDNDPDVPLELTPSALTELGQDPLALTPSALTEIPMPDLSVDILPDIPTPIYENLSKKNDDEDTP